MNSCILMHYFTTYINISFNICFNHSSHWCVWVFVWLEVHVGVIVLHSIRMFDCSVCVSLLACSPGSAIHFPFVLFVCVFSACQTNTNLNQCFILWRWLTVLFWSIHPQLTSADKDNLAVNTKTSYSFKVHKSLFDCRESTKNQSLICKDFTNADRKLI